MKIEETKECVAEAIGLIASGPINRQLEGIDALNQLCSYGRLMRIGLSPEQSMTLMLAAFRKYPPSNDFLDFGNTYRQKLLLILCQSPHPVLCHKILELYPHIDAANDGERWQLLMLLSEMPQRAAVEFWIHCYAERFERGDGVPPPYSSTACHVEHADLLLPAMIKFSKSDNAWLADQWNAHLRTFLTALPPQSATFDEIIQDLQQLLDRLDRFQLQPPGKWMWESEYFDLRWKISSRAELLGYASKAATDVLRRASHGDDPKIRLASSISLLQLGAAIHPDLLQPVAAWPETRYPLYVELRRLNKPNLFPRQFAAQHLLAESDLVTYLVEDGDSPPENLTYAGSLAHDGNKFHAFEFGPTDHRSLGLSGPWPQKGLEKIHQCGISTSSRRRDNNPPLDQARNALAEMER